MCLQYIFCKANGFHLFSKTHHFLVPRHTSSQAWLYSCIYAWLSITVRNNWPEKNE